MNTAQKKFKRTMKSRERRKKIVRLGRNNHGMANAIMSMRSKGQIKMGRPQAPKEGVGSKLKRAFGLGGKKIRSRQKAIA